MAALVALLTNKARRRELDMAVFQRRISAVKRMPESENNLMNFILPFSVANLAQDRKTISRDEMRSKKWWEDGLQTGRSRSSRKDFGLVDTPFISFLEKIKDLITKETTRFEKPNPTLKTVFVFRLDINLETNYPS